MEFKKNPWLYGLWGVVVIVLGALVFTKKLDWSTASGFLVMLGLPSILGLKAAASDTPPKDTPPDGPTDGGPYRSSAKPADAPPTTMRNPGGGSVNRAIAQARAILRFRARPLAVGLVAAIALSAIAGCSLLTKENAKSALEVVQVACVMSSTLTNDADVAKACKIADDLIPVVHDLIGQREAAKRSGVKWGDGFDAGAPTDAGADGAAH